MFFVIDYTTRQHQPLSKLCNIADELLLKISHWVFANCELEYWSQSDNAYLTYDSVVRMPNCGALEGLNFLRTCKLIRGKLLPSYIKDATLGIFSPLRQYDGMSSTLYVTIPDLAARMIPFVTMPTAAIRDIKKLELSAAAHHIIDPRLFPNLEKIILHKRGMVTLTLAQTHSNALLLQECQDHAHVPSTATLAVLGGNPYLSRPIISDWIRELIDLLSSSAATANIQVIMVHEMYTQGFHKDGFRGRVFHDLTNNALLGKTAVPKDMDRWHKIMGEPGNVKHDDGLLQFGTRKIMPTREIKPTFVEGKERFNPAGASRFTMDWINAQSSDPWI